jgi:hypothetical protein
MGMTGANMRKLLGIVVCVVLGFGANASAASIVGTLNFTGDVTVTATTIDWQDRGGVSNAIIMETSDGYFQNLDSEDFSVGYASAIDLTAPQQTQDDFLHTFQENPDVPSEYDDLTFDLTDIVEPTAAPCVPGATYTSGQSCSLGVFTLTASPGGGTTITLDVLGNFDDPSLGAIDSPAVGIYTAQRNESIQQIVAVFLPGGSGTFFTSYSASFTAVPEPATLLTFGAGTALMAAYRRRRAKKNNA